MVIRAKNDKSALEQIEKARNKGWIKNDKRSASDILAEQAIDPFYKKAPGEKEIFDKENPYWADFFSDRQ